jgi:hypothetical protein
MSEEAPDAAQACGWCGATGKLLRCGGCRATWFCNNGKACLKAAWQAGHKEECKAVAAAAAAAASPFDNAAATAASARALSPAPAFPAAMKTRPIFAAHPESAGAAESKPYQTDEYGDPLDEDDECGICAGDHLPRNGRGVVSLKCSHRSHRALVGRWSITGCHTL